MKKWVTLISVLFCFTINGIWAQDFTPYSFNTIALSNPKKIGIVENNGSYEYKVLFEETNESFWAFGAGVDIPANMNVKIHILHNEYVELGDLSTLDDKDDDWLSYFNVNDLGGGIIEITQKNVVTPLSDLNPDIFTDGGMVLSIPFNVLQNAPNAQIKLGNDIISINKIDYPQSIFFTALESLNYETVAPCPTLVIEQVICDGATYSVKFNTDAHDINDTTYFTFNAGNLDAANNMITNIPRGTNLTLVANNNNGCSTPVTVDGGSGPCPPTCETPDLSLGQPVCTDTGYAVAFSVNDGATVTVEPTTGVTIDTVNNIINVDASVASINVIATDGDCEVKLTATKPVDCGEEPCNNVAISVGDAVCSPGLSDTYRVPFVLDSGAVITAPTTGITYIAGTNDKQGFIEVASGVDVTITASIDGCPDGTTIEISGRSCPECDLSATSIITRASCNATDGEVNVTVDNTVNPTYVWTMADDSALPAGAVTNNEDLSNVGKGNYKLTITDGNCELVHFVTLEEKPECNNPPNCDLELSYTATDMTCAGSDGSVNITATGSGNLTYAWSASDGGVLPAGVTPTTSSLSNLTAGTYTITVTSDVASGCSKTTVVKVQDGCNAPCDLEVVVDVTQIDCSDSGQLKANVSGGTGTYTIEWKDSATNTVAFTGAVFNLNPADHAGKSFYVEVTDSNNCTAGVDASAAIAIVDTCGCELSATSIVTPTACADDKLTGKIEVSVTNVSADATYKWTRTDGGTIPATVATESTTLEGVGEGSYKLTITDGVAPNPVCTLEHYVNVEKKPECNNPTDCDIELTYQASDKSCDGDDGSITLDATSTGSLTFAWTATGGGAIPTGQEEDQNLTGLVPGLYTVVVSSDAGASCKETHTIEIKDGCKDECNLQTSIDVEQLDCAGNGMLRASVSGGIAPFTITWKQDGNTAFSHIGATLPLTSGDKGKKFYVEVTDKKGCTSGLVSSEAITVEDDCLCQITATSIVTPTNCSTDDGAINLVVTNATGTPTFAWTKADGDPIGGSIVTNQEDISGLAEGAYKVVIKDGDDCEIEHFVNVEKKPECNNPPNCDIEVTYESSNETCAKNDGSISINVVSTGTLTYAWSATDGGTVPAGMENAEDLSGLTQGTYTVVVSSDSATDCSKEVTVNVGDGCKDECNLQAVVDVEQIDCAGNGEFKVSVSGGVAPFTITWKEVGTAFSQSGATLTLAAGDVGRKFYVEVTDAKGCTSGLLESEAIEVTNDCGCQLSATSVATPTDCSSLTGKVDLTVSGETATGFLWTMANGDPLPAGIVSNQEDLNNVGAGTYKVVITGDKADCEMTHFVTVDEKPECKPVDCNIQASYEAFDMTCAQNDGRINVTASGTGTLTYTWTAADGGEIPATTTTATTNLTGLKKGTYTVVINDDGSTGCTETLVVTINDGCKEECNLQTFVDVEQVNCEGAGALRANVSGGLGSYTIVWKEVVAGGTDIDVHTGAVFNLTTANIGKSYYVSVTDEKNCESGVSDSKAIAITDACGCQLSFSSNSNEASCFQDDGSIDMFVQGYSALANITITVKDAADKTYTLSGALTENTTTNSVEATVGSLPEGIYTITVKDDKGDLDDTNDCEEKFIVNVDKKDECDPKECTMDVSAETFNVSCDGDDGGVKLTINDASDIANVRFKWVRLSDLTEVSVSKDLEGITLANIGTYEVTITDTLGDTNDDNDCIKVLRFEIKDGCNPACNLSVNVESENCEGNLIASVANGVGPYTYEWFDEANLGTVFSTNPILTGIDTSKTFKLVVTDEGATKTCSKELSGLKADETKCSPDFRVNIYPELSNEISQDEDTELIYFIDVDELNDNGEKIAGLFLRIQSSSVLTIAYEATSTNVTGVTGVTNVNNLNWTVTRASSNIVSLRHNNGLFPASGTSKVYIKVKYNPEDDLTGVPVLSAQVFSREDSNLTNNISESELSVEKD